MSNQLIQNLLNLKDTDQQGLYIAELYPIVSKNGINSHQLHLIIDGLIQPKQSSSLTTSSKVHIIESLLLPNEKIPKRIVLKILGSLGTGPSFSEKKVQVLLVKWIWAVSFFVKNSSSVFSVLNSALFNLLSLSYLEPWICQILFVTTKRTHLKPWRFKLLLDLSRRSQNVSHYLHTLLAYFTMLLDGPSALNQASARCIHFPNLERWSKVFHQNKSLRSSFEVARDEFIGKLYSLHSTFSNKRRRMDNSLEIVQIGKVSHKEIQWNHINTPYRLIRDFRDITVPQLVHSIFRNGLLFHILSVEILAQTKTSPFFSDFENYVRLLIENKAFEELDMVVKGYLVYTKITGKLGASIREILEIIPEKRLPESSKHLLLEFLPLFTIPVALVPLLTDLSNTMIKSLLKLYSDSDFELSCSILIQLTRGFQNWALQAHAEEDEDVKNDQFAYLADFYTKIQTPILDSLNRFQHHKDHDRLIYLALSFLLATQSLPIDGDYFRMPTSFFFYRGLLSTNPILVDVACSQIVHLKNYPLNGLIAGLKDSQPQKEYYEAAVQERNALVLDACNALWRHRLFDNSSSRGFFVDVDVLKGSGSLLSMENSPAFVDFIKPWVIARRDQTISNINVRPITKEYFELNSDDSFFEGFKDFDDLRLSLLKGITEENQLFSGVYSLLTTSLKSLRRKSGGQRSRSFET